VKKAKRTGKGRKRSRAGKDLCLLSWNVNGIRAAGRKGFLDWLADASPDILCLQETRALPEQLTAALRQPPGYHTIINPAERKGYSGTAIYARTEPEDVLTELGAPGYDDEGRVILAEYPFFWLINVYVPNGRSDLSRVPYKLAFSDHLLERARRLRKGGKPVVLCGDFNTAHREIDLARPRENAGNTGFLPEERAWLDRFTGEGYVDTFRHFHPEETGRYTWWDQRTRARPRNIGWRLDYVFASEEFLPSLRSAVILADVMGSDHCPVGITFRAE
jgi:exodeoxyribonuclease-3